MGYGFEKEHNPFKHFLKTLIYYCISVLKALNY